MSAQAGINMSEKNFNFIFSVLKHCDQIKPNWEQVAAENGIGYARNAASRFKDIIKKAGYGFEDGRVVDVNGNGNGSAPATPKAPKTPKTPKAKNAKTANATPNGHTAKKRKITDTVVDEESDATSIKDEDGIGAVKDENGEEESA